MKQSKNIIKLGLIFVLTISSFSFTKTISLCDNIPELNKQIIDFVKTNLKKKVGSGECWDLAAEALNKIKAKWDGKQNFGKQINYLKDCVYPGDIIQFEGAMLNYEIDKKFYVEKLLHHTAIIYEVKENGNYVIADQNTRESGKTVSTHIFEVKTITKGTFKIYRPTK